MTRAAPKLHRDDPAKTPLAGHVKVTRDDWLNAARFVLIDRGVAEVKILTLAEHLGVSRSSFYWYFNDRNALLSALIEDWEGRNTALLLQHCEMPADTISAAVCNFFRCFVDATRFDPGLDFAIRAWARQDVSVRARIDAADSARLSAIQDMYARFSYAPRDASARARILYFQQLGYHALELQEPMSERMRHLEGYLYGFTGVEPDAETCANFRAFAASLDS